MKKFLALALTLLTIIFVSGVEAGVVTDSLPFQCYVDHQVDTYNQPGASQRAGYISANVDLIQVTQVRGDGWAYGSYPGAGGKKVARWFRLSELFPDMSYSNRPANVQGAQRVFRTRGSSDTIGSVSDKESVTVLADNGSRAQILYRLDNGTGYKVGWIPSSSVPSRNVQPVPSPIANTVTISNGWYRIQPMHDLGRSVDALGPQIGSGNNIHVWSNADVLQQKFYLENRGNGYFSLQSAYGSKLFVTVDGRGNGANLYTAAWSNSDSQLFRLVNAGDNSYHVFAKVGVNLNFDCAGAGKSDGNNVQLWTSENNPWHKWRFTRVSENNKANFQFSSYSLTSPSNYQLRFTGRLWNANNSSEITGVHVYIGGGVGAGGQFLGEFRADKSNHTFDSTINVPQNRGGNQLVVIYAVNGVESKELDRRNINIQGSTPSGTYIWPIKNPSYDNYTINTLYYYSNKRNNHYEHSTWYAQYHGGQFNSLDIRAATGKEVVAVAAGTVIKCNDPASRSSAKYIKIQHGATESLYAHLSRIDVSEGQSVSAGQVIGLSGDTGAVGSPHLHFEFSNVNAFKYYRDRYPLHYRIWISNAYDTVKNVITANNRKEFKDAIDWINTHGDCGFIN